MTDLIGIDFESTYTKDRNASTLGPMAYLMHPETEVFLVSAYDGKECMVVDPYDPVDCGADGWDWLFSAKAWVSHNRTFDMAAYRRLQHDLGLPDPPTWHCSADLAAYLGCRRALEMAAEHLLLAEKPDKDIRTKWRNKTKKEIFESPDIDEYLDYAANDAILTYDLWREWQKDFPNLEQRLSQLTTWQCHSGIGIDVDLLKSEIKRLDVRLWELENEIPWVGEIHKKKPLTVRSSIGLKNECARLGIPAPSTTAKNSMVFDRWCNNYREAAPWIDSVLEYRSVARILDLLKNVKRRLGVEGYEPWVMPFGLKFMGTNTGRWSGDGGINMQNPPRQPISGCNFRNIFIPTYEDQVFIVADLSQIEARVMLWEVGDEVQLDMLREGMDLYEIYARLRMGYDDPRPLAQVDNDLRRYCKVVVLGLQYRAGPPTFVKQAWAEHRYSISLAKARHTVKQYRRANKLIVKYWKRLEQDLAQAMIKDEDRCYYDPLPSGRYLYYFDIHRQRGLRARTSMGDFLRHIHGGLRAENRCSAIARDIFVRYVDQLHSPECQIKFTVHDELIAEVPRKRADDILDHVIEVMSIPPPWARDLPVACEATIKERYDKS